MLVKPEKLFTLNSDYGKLFIWVQPYFKIFEIQKAQRYKKTEKANLTHTLSDGLYENHRP